MRRRWAWCPKEKHRDSSRLWGLDNYCKGKSPADGETPEEKAQRACALQPEVQPERRGRDTERPE